MCIALVGPHLRHLLLICVCPCTAAPCPQQCGFTEAAALQAREAYPPLPVIHGTVLAEPQAAAAAAVGAVVAAAADADAAAEKVAGLSPLARPQMLAALGMAAAGGALAALLWTKRLGQQTRSLPSAAWSPPR